MKLLSQNVEKLFKDCLSENGTLVEGVIVKAKLNITGHEEDIMSLLLQLPENFYQSKGGGWSFLCANETKDGTEWTGLHTIIEKLIVLGIAAGKAKYLLPRNLWQALPGEMPYFVILDKPEEIVETSHE
jgi:hypothetical protein